MTRPGGGENPGDVVHVALSLDAAGEALVRARLRQHGSNACFVPSVAELHAALPDCSWLFVGRPPRFDWSAARRLRLLQIAGTGVDPLFPAVGLREDVPIANTRGAHATAVRDHAILLLLALARGLPRMLGEQAARRWSRFESEPVAGKLLTVLGFGAVGARVVETSLALGLEVRVVRRTPVPIPGVDRVATCDGLHETLVDADYVIVSLPLTRATGHLLDEAALARLPERASLIDVSRGGVVDQRALEAALRGNRLRAAALDVFEDEPLPPGSSLWSCPNLVITPHVAGLTPDYLERTLDVFLGNMDRVRKGDPLLTPVSREHEY
jgi:phosphoglycerate dehydrogenase-like enzyme